MSSFSLPLLFSKHTANNEQLTHGNFTYTATASETVTITDCPCTLTKSVTTIDYTSCGEGEVTSAPTVAPTVAPPAVEPSPTHNAPVGPGTSVPTAPSHSPSFVPSNGAGSNKAAAGLAVAAVAGVVALAF